MIKLIVILTLSLATPVLSSCISLGSRESSVTLSDGKTVRVRCQSDGVVDFTQGDIKVKVDNRGPVGQVWAAGTASLGKIYETVKGPEVAK